MRQQGEGGEDRLASAGQGRSRPDAVAAGWGGEEQRGRLDMAGVGEWAQTSWGGQTWGSIPPPPNRS